MGQKIVLGTVQFGLSYGVANNSGKVSNDEATKIIQLAKESGVTKLDTAVAYGNSEEVLGNIGVDEFDVVTKIPIHPAGTNNIRKWLIGEIERSRRFLNTCSLYAVMLHSPSILSIDDGVMYWDVLNELKNNGVIRKIGYSIYEPEEIDRYYEKFQPDIIQAPYNIIDNRLKESGWLEKLNDDSVEVYVRSIFLQGLLLMNKNQRPRYFKQWDDMWSVWDQWLIDENVTALEAALGFVMNDDSIKNIVIGVDSAVHLQDILTVSTKKLERISPMISSKDTALLNPSKWVL